MPRRFRTNYRAQTTLTFSYLEVAPTPLADQVELNSASVFTNEIAQLGNLSSNTFDDVQTTVLGSSPGAVPEPSTWAMMLLGFAGLGFAFRQSRRKAAFA